MFQIIRNSVFSKAFWGLMGLYLLNISVDPIDIRPEYFSEDLSFNDQESIVEIIVEKVLGYEDAILEYDDIDNDDLNKKASFKIDHFTYSNFDTCSRLNSIARIKKKFPDHLNALANGFYNLDVPPPKG